MGVCSLVASSTLFIPSREPVTRLLSVGSALCPRFPSRLFRSCIYSFVPVSLSVFVPRWDLHSSICPFMKPWISFFDIWLFGVSTMSPNLASASSPLCGEHPLGLPTSSYLHVLALAIPRLIARIAPLLGGGGAFGSALLSLAVTSFKVSLCLGFLPPLGLHLSPFCLTVGACKIKVLP